MGTDGVHPRRVRHRLLSLDAGNRGTPASRTFRGDRQREPGGRGCGHGEARPAGTAIPHDRAAHAPDEVGRSAAIPRRVNGWTRSANNGFRSMAYSISLRVCVPTRSESSPLSSGRRPYGPRRRPNFRWRHSKRQRRLRTSTACWLPTFFPEIPAIWFAETFSTRNQRPTGGASSSMK